MEKTNGECTKVILPTRSIDFQQLHERNDPSGISCTSDELDISEQNGEVRKKIAHLFLSLYTIYQLK